jgi:hypothetical protein
LTSTPRASSGSDDADAVAHVAACRAIPPRREAHEHAIGMQRVERAALASNPETFLTDC